MPARFQYSRWDGTQNVDAVDADDVLDALSDDLMSYGDLSAALQRLYRWGAGDMPGLEQLLRQLRERRERELSRYDLDSTVESIREQLQDVIDTERTGIDRKVDQAPQERRKLMEKLAKQRRNQLDRMPDDLGGRMKSLRQYEFMDEEAREKFERLLEQLQQQMLEQMFQGLKQSIQSMTREDLGLVREMVRDLNRMLEQRRQGLDTSASFRDFMQKYGQMFPPGIETLDQLLEHLQRQMAQMQSLMQSLSPQARDELRRMMDELLQDDSLRLELARLGAMMQQLMPPSEMTERYPFFGDEPLSLQEAMGLMEVLQKAGYVERRDRRLELTPRGMRRIGQGALREIFDQLKKSRLGHHNTRNTGQGVEPGEEVKAYEYGDPFLLDMNETLFNSLQREGRGLPVKIEPPDFIVRRTEHSSQASTVLMIDMSRSMFLRGCFLAAKKVAIALDSLIRSQFPRDSLYVVGFSNYAGELKAPRLPAITLHDSVYGTNMQHGFQLARSLLARHRGNRQVIMVTDGEPTAHLDENGRTYFAYPPTFRTIQETLREVRRCTRDRIVINTFMLERGPYLTEFINQMTRINKGRAFFVSPERLGEYILVDYVSGKQRRQRSRAS